MKSLVVLVFVVGAVWSCRAQDEFVVVGKVLADGTVKPEVTPSHLFPAIELFQAIPVDDHPLYFRMSFTEGQTRYLSCEVRDFVIAFECKQVGEHIIIHSNGTTHLGTSTKCLNPTFQFSSTGKLIGCTCEDKLYDGPARTCNHTMHTPQSAAVEAITEALRSRE